MQLKLCLWNQIFWKHIFLSRKYACNILFPNLADFIFRNTKFIPESLSSHFLLFRSHGYFCTSTMRRDLNTTTLKKYIINLTLIHYYEKIYNLLKWNCCRVSGLRRRQSPTPQTTKVLHDNGSSVKLYSPYLHFSFFSFPFLYIFYKSIKNLLWIVPLCFTLWLSPLH